MDTPASVFALILVFISIFTIGYAIYISTNINKINKYMDSIMHIVSNNANTIDHNNALIGNYSKNVTDIKVSDLIVGDNDMLEFTSDNIRTYKNNKHVNKLEVGEKRIMLQ
jgi:hypothetical protein